MAPADDAPSYTVRPFRPGDAADVSALFHAAVHRTGARHYAPEQLVAWSPRPPDPARFVVRSGDGRLALVIVDARDRVVAYGDLERDGHLDLLYCHPDHGGRGLASRLCDALEEQARAWKVPFLFVEASEAARPVFERRGYATEERRDFRVGGRIGGVAIHNYRMTRCP